jgi:1-propanol dehydrogenase
METFWIKPKLYFGPEPLEALSALAGKRVLIVTDAFLASSGLLARVKARLTGEVSVFDRVEPAPSLRLVAEGVRAVRTFRPERWWPSAAAPPWTAPRPCAGFPATGTCRSTVSPPPRAPAARSPPRRLTDTDQGVKYPLVEDGLLPEGAILEPAFLDGVPPKVTADTGMDVLTHAAEAAAAVGANPFTDALAESAFALAWRALPRAYQGDRAAKAEMLYASCMAGVAFNAAGLGVCHSMAHALGGRFHVAHGRLNALLLPQVVAFNAADARAAEKYARLARRCGLAANPRALSAALVRLRTGLGIPARLDLPPAELKAALPALSAAALSDVCLPGNPRPVAAADVEAMMEALV